LEAVGVWARIGQGEKMPCMEHDDFAIIAEFIVQKDKALGRELVYVIDEWDALRDQYDEQTEQGKTTEENENLDSWERGRAERLERLRPLRDALRERAFK
jgi:hypothetical protein